jgi:hypothetical protein
MKNFLVLLVFLGSSLVRAESYGQLRIFQPSTGGLPTRLEVYPNQVVDLAADVWASGPQHYSPSEFLWTSEDRPNNVCDPYSASVCQAETNFAVSSSGVQFRVPGSFSGPITIMARQRGGELQGAITLVPAPQVAVVEPTGHWVVVNGLSVWQPIVVAPLWHRYPYGGWHPRVWRRWY